MRPLTIQSGTNIPKVKLDADKGEFLFEGKSCPEDVRKFYTPIFEWIKEYSKAPKKHTVVEFKMSYYNTASAKMLLNVMQRFEEIVEAGNDVTIKWYYPEEDEDLRESGEDYNDMVEVPFELIPYKFRK